MEAETKKLHQSYISNIIFFISSLDQDYDDWIKDMESSPIPEEEDIPNVDVITHRACKNNVGEIVPCAQIDPNQYFNIHR